jgi:hypothetical protein
MWRHSQHDDELAWATDDEGDTYTADPRDGVRFVICSELVHDRDKVNTPEHPLENPGVACLRPASTRGYVGRMSQIPLDPRGGTAPQLRCRVLDDDLARLAELAAQYGGNRSAVVRRALALGLDALEREQGPPDGGG